MVKKKTRCLIILLLLLLVQSGCDKTGQVSDTSTSELQRDTINTSELNTVTITPAAGNNNMQDRPYLYPVKNNLDKWGYIDSDGELIIDFIYDYAGFFTDGAAIVCLNGMYGLIGLDGRTIIKPQYDYIGRFSEGLAHVVKNEAGNLKHGFINKEGTVFYRDYFNNNTGDFHDGLAVFEQEQKFGYVNKNGDIIIQPMFFMAYDFSEGLATVANENDKHGFIDTSGNLVIPFQFEHNMEGTIRYEGFHEGLAAVCVDEKFGYIDKNGDFVIDPVFDYAERFNDGVALVIVDGLYGYIDKKGNYVIEPQFAYASSFLNGYAFVRKAGKKDYEETGGYALINKVGDFITDENLIYEDGGGYVFISEWSVGFVEELARVAMMVDNKPKLVYINNSGEIVWESE